MKEQESEKETSTPSGPHRGRRRRRRLLVVLVFLPLLLAVLAVAALVLGLQITAVRQAVLEEVTETVEESLGVRATARDFDLDLSLGTSKLEIYDLAISAPDAPAQPVLTTARLRADVVMRSLLRSYLVLPAVEIEAPRIDLEAPMPTLETAEEKPEAESDVGFEIQRLTLTDGAIVGGTTPAGMAPTGTGTSTGIWLERWQADGLTLTGNLSDQALDLRLEPAAITATGGGQRLVLALTAAVAGPLAGPYELRTLTLAGDGVDLSASGHIGLAPEDPLALRFDLAADPARLIPDVAAGGRIEATGDLDLRAWRGTAQVRATAVPGEILAPWVDPALMTQLAMAGTTLGMQADLDLAGAEPEEISLQAEAQWMGDEETLLTAAVRTLAPPATGGMTITSEVALLPAVAGQRRLDATLHATRLEALLEGEIKTAELALTAPELSALLRDVRRHWPQLLPTALDTLPLRGPLTLDGQAHGSLTAPQAAAEGRWRPAGRGEIAFTAAGEPVAQQGTVRLTLQDIALESFDFGFGGTVSGRIDVRGRPDAFTGNLEIDGFGLTVNEELPPIEALHIAAEANSERLALTALSGTWGTGRFSGHGEVDLTLPLRRAVMTLALETPIEGIDRAELAFDLDAGVLQIEAPILDTATGPGTLSATVPLGALAALPQVGDALAELPLVTADGRVEVALALPEIDSESLRPWLGDEMADVMRLRGGVRADLDLDLGQPAAGAGEIIITPMTIDLEAASIAAEEPLRLTLGANRLVLEPARIRAAGRPFSFAGAAVLAPDWQPDAELTALLESFRFEASGTVDPALLPASLRVAEPGAIAVEIEAAGDKETVQATARLGGEEGAPLAVVLPAFVPGTPAWTAKVAAVTLDATLDPADPLAGTGTLTVSELEAMQGRHRVTAEAPLRLELGDRQLQIAPLRLLTDDQALALDGGATFAPDWRPGDDPSGLVADVNVSLDGTVAGGLLTPYLAGGVASGPFTIALTASGPLDALDAHFTLDGEKAKIGFLGPYVTTFEAPQAEIEMVDGALRIERFTTRLNEGALDVSGSWSSAAGADVEATMAGVRLRVDYGLSLLLSGALHFTLPPEKDGRISGSVNLDRGLLRRDLDVDREVLNVLFAPAALGDGGGGDDLLSRIGLDFKVTTVDGVRVKNNVGDLRVVWDPLTVRGSLGVPIIQGVVEVEPGGEIYAYGQAVRLDQASLTFRGDPNLPPELAMETTTSLEDPSVGRKRSGQRRDIFAELAAEDEFGPKRDVEEALKSGLASYYGARVADQLTGSLGTSRLQIRPELAFGENDPEARLNFDQRISTNASFILSVDLRSAENRTYTLDLHNFRFAPSLNTQFFTNDASNEGVLVQQFLELGRGTREEERGPRLRKIIFDNPDEIAVKERALRRAVGLRRNDVLLAGTDFDVEVDVIEALRRRGFPGADATVRIEPRGERGERADVRVTVQPGPKATFVFTGDAPPRARRASITSLYRIDFYEEASLLDIERQAIRVFRGVGHLDPKVTVTADMTDPGADRTVTIHTAAGRRLDLELPVFTGVDPEDADLLSQRFASRLARTQLAAGVEEADERVRSQLRTLGYPQATIRSRSIAEDGVTLTLALDPGPRQRVAVVRVVGVSDEEAARLQERLQLSAGEPLRSGRVVLSALGIEDELRARGYSEARVRTDIAAEGDDPYAFIVTFAVDIGTRHRIADIEVQGDGATRPRWAERVTRLEPGEIYQEREVSKGRRNLLRTGLFSAVHISSDRVAPEVEGGGDGDTAVTFSLVERPRYHLAYGLRYASNEGTSVVVDLSDRNFFGRGVTLGFRSLYSEDDRRNRIYTILPQIFGTRASLEIYGEQRHLVEQRTITLPPVLRETIDRTADSEEISLQLSVPIGRYATGRVYGKYRETEFDTDDDFFRPFVQQTIRSPLLGLQWLRDTRDDPVASTRGLFASVDLSGAGDYLGSDDRYLRFFGQVNYFHTPRRFLGGRLTWAQSFRIGVAEAFGDTTLAEDLRFLAGGEYSVRGYPTETLGPLDRVDDVLRPVGGEGLLVINQELRFPLFWLFSGVAFVDAGNVWEDYRDFASDLRTAVGFGLRAETPVGLLRVDFGYPLDRRPDDPEYKVYVGLGHAF